MGLKDLLSGARAKPANASAPRASAAQAISQAEDTRAHAQGFVPGTWPMERLDVLEDVWGKGCLHPGAHEDLVGLMNVCALSPAKTMLDIGSGIGGASRAMVNKFGVWLVGIERDETLVAEANRRSLIADLDKKAVFYACDYETLALKPSGYDAILCRYALSSAANKEGIYDQFVEGLKPSAHLVIVDFVIGEAQGNEAILKRLWECEVPKLQPVRAGAVAAALKKRNFLLHVAKDITDEVMPRIVAGWARFGQTLKPGVTPRLTAEIILHEAAKWEARVAALQSGAIRVYRFHATNSAEQKKGRVSTLSDWKY